ncbi:MAG: hypothetical protein ABFD46_11285 [Armatimonadota bacterium]
MDLIKIRADYYQQFDADFNLDVPGEGYGGWKKAEIDVSTKHTALIVMHAWDMGSREEYPGWHRAVEYIPRASEIYKTIFPTLLEAVRNSNMRLIHVVSGSYYQNLPAYLKTVELAGPEPEQPAKIEVDPVTRQLWKFREKNVFVGEHNDADVNRGFAEMGFPPEARPLDNEYIAENSHQLFAICKAHGINHLIYTGFAINWCLLLSPGGMADMSRKGIMCSAIRQAVTAVENKETAREEICKQIALWRVALEFGFVFDLYDFLSALS